MRYVSSTTDSLDFDLLSEAALSDPWKFLVPIREKDPIFWSDIQHAWMVTRHADVKVGYADRRLSVARMRFFIDRLTTQVDGGLPTVEKYVPLIVNFIDPPDLNRIRMLMFQAFKPTNVESMRPAARLIIQQLLDQAGQKGEIEFMSEIATELPIRMLMKVLGVPEKFKPEFLALVSANGESLGSSNPVPQTMKRLEEALKTAFGIFSELIAVRERTPQPDFLSALVHARDNNSRLSHDELLVACFTIMAAGVETTAGAMGVFLRTVAERAHLQQFIRENPGPIRNFIEELNRYPSEVKGMLRVAVEDFDWGGRHIREGDMVYLMHASANTDPAVFDRPFEIDPTRNTQQSLGWGFGFHACIGQLLAKMELDEFFKACFERFDVQIIQPEFTYSKGFALTVYKELRTRLVPRSDAIRAA
jgi:pimeloyl-[acyl-carrier protein] synthase